MSAAGTLCVKGDNGAVGVFSYLTGRLIREATEHAFAHGDLHLTLLMSQALGSEDIRNLIMKELVVWLETQVREQLALDLR